MHKLLQRQIERIKRRSPDGSVPLDQLLEIVSATYEETDLERRKKERAMKLMSDELLALNTKIREESDQYITAILDNVVDGIVTFDTDGIIRSFNGPMERLFLLRESHAIGQHISILTPEKAEEKDFWESYLKKQEGTPATVVMETIAVDQQNREFPIDVSISELRMQEAPIHIAIIRDISIRKEFEHALVSAKEYAEEASAAKANFLSTMSHEIRTPMNAVIGLTNLLLQQYPREDQLENLQILKFSGENLLVLINDILDFNKIEAGKLDIESIEFNLFDVVKSVQKALNIKAKEKGIYLNLEMSANLPEQMKGDPVRLAQILNNLMGNAIKFTETGSVTLIVRIESQTETEIFLDFQVNDTGIGIPADKLDSIFESFNQSDSSITRKYGGTGLGLAITRRLLELQNSNITVESTVGKGSQFSFLLRFEKSTQVLRPKAQPADISRKTLVGHRILLVEDNKINQIVAAKFLSNWGLVVEIADNGKIAVEMILKNEYDLVLMDLQMPEMDGYQATKVIREFEHERFQHLPIIALTASAMQPIQAQVKAVGMNDFISKPFQPDDLFTKLRRHIPPKIVNI